MSGTTFWDALDSSNLSAFVEEAASVGINLFPLRSKQGEEKLPAVKWGCFKGPNASRCNASKLATRVLARQVRGVGIVCGVASSVGGHSLTLFEFESHAGTLHKRCREEFPELFARLDASFVVWSGRGGTHYWILTDEVLHCSKLSMDVELGTMAELKGEGGFGVSPFSHGGRGRRYDLLSPLGNISHFSRDELKPLFDFLREESCDREKLACPFEGKPARRSVAFDGDLDLRRADHDFNVNGDPAVALRGYLPAGRGTHGSTLWLRPGQRGTPSCSVLPATAAYPQTVRDFSTNAEPLPADESLSLFRAYCLTHHGKYDRETKGRARRELASLGYGEVEEQPKPAGETQSIEEWRLHTAYETDRAASKPGIYLNAGPTGVGKTTAMMQVMRSGEHNTLTVVPTHALANEFTRERIREGFAASAAPEHGAHNCDDWKAASRVLAFGLSPAAVVCGPGKLDRDAYAKACKEAFRRGGVDEVKKVKKVWIPSQCGYIRDVEEAKGSPHLAVTAARFALTSSSVFEIKDSDDFAEGDALCTGYRKVCFIDEEVSAALAPTIEASMKSVDAAMVAMQAARATEIYRSSKMECSCGQEQGREKKTKQLGALATAVDTMIGVLERLAAGTGLPCDGAAEISIKPPFSSVTEIARDYGYELEDEPFPRAWQKELAKVLRATSVPVSTAVKEGMSLASAVVAQRLRWCRVVRTGTQITFVGCVRVQIPEGVSVICSDATTAAEDLEALLGMSVQDFTLPGHLEPIHPIVQIPVDVTKSDGVEYAARLVEGFLEDRRDVFRLGVICHREHVEAINNNPRISMVHHFGSGVDRGSNEWVKQCDHLIVLGTPRVSPHSLRCWLATHNLPADGDGALSSFTWRSRSGQVVDGLRYDDHNWQRAYRAMVTSTIRQALGRGRATLDGGIPVTLFTTDPFEFEVLPPLSPITKAAFAIREEARAAGGVLKTTGWSGGRRRAAREDGSINTLRRGEVRVPGESCCWKCGELKTHRVPIHNGTGYRIDCSSCDAAQHVRLNCIWGYGTEYEMEICPIAEEADWDDLLEMEIGEAREHGDSERGEYLMSLRA